MANKIDPSRRLNIGCGPWPLIYWTNLDADPAMPADIHVEVPPIPYPDQSLDEIYAGHVLEHLTQTQARLFLDECYRCLTPGGTIGVVVPDLEEVMRRYLDPHQENSDVVFDHRTWSIHDMDAICSLFLYSTVQESPHQWMYSPRTLYARMIEAGFVNLVPINKWSDPRITVGAWYQFGWEGTRPVLTS